MQISHEGVGFTNTWREEGGREGGGKCIFGVFLAWAVTTFNFELDGRLACYYGDTVGSEINKKFIFLDLLERRN